MSQFLLSKERLEELENKVGLTPEEAQELFAHIGELNAALSGLMTNPHLSLGDLVYTVRDREGEGWEGPAVVAWSNAVTASEALHDRYRFDVDHRL